MFRARTAPNLSFFAPSTFVRKVGHDLLFPSTATDIHVDEPYKLQVQGLSTKMYGFSVGYTLDRQIRNTFILRIYRDRTEEKMSREYRALKILKAHGIPVPTAFILEMDKRTIGEPFMIMEKIEGASASHFLRNEEHALTTVNMLAELLALVHRLDPTVLFHSNRLGNQSEFAQQRLSQIKKLINIEYITSLSPFRRRKYLDAAKNLEETKMKHFRQALVHGDFGPDHVLITQKGPVVVDWEGISSGDPAYDVGWTYHILMLEGRNVIDHRFVKFEEQKTANVDLREQFVKCYEKHTGRKLDNLEFYKDLVALGLAARYDLYLRLGPFSMFRNLLLIGAKQTFARTLFARSATKSFQNYCIRFLESRGIL